MGQKEKTNIEAEESCLERMEKEKGKNSSQQAKGEKMKEKELLVCPQCGSTDLHWLLGGQTGDQYKCPKCNYHGIALRGNIRFIKELKKKGAD
jgi:transposase-like protein